MPDGLDSSTHTRDGLFPENFVDTRILVVDEWLAGNMSALTAPSTFVGQRLNLALATWTSAINFWAWNMIGPLSTTYAGDLSLSSTEAVAAGRDPDPGRFGGPDRRSVHSPTASVAASCSSSSRWRRSRRCWRSGSPVRVRLLSRCCWCSASFSGSPERSSRSVSRSPTTGTSRRGAASRPAFSERHGRHRAVGVLHAAVRAVVRAVHHPRRSSRSRWPSTARAVRGGDAELARLHPNTDPVLPKLKAAGEAARHLGDVVPVRGGVRRVRRVQQLPADLHQDDLRFLASRCRCPHRRVRARGGDRPADRRHRCPTGSRPKYRGAGVACRHRGAGVRRGIPAAAGRVVGGDVHRAGVLPRHRHRRRVRLGGPSRPARSSRLGHRNRRRRRRVGRLLPAAGDGGDLRLGRQQLHHRSVCCWSRPRSLALRHTRRCACTPTNRLPPRREDPTT